MLIGLIASGRGLLDCFSDGGAILARPRQPESVASDLKDQFTKPSGSDLLRSLLWTMDRLGFSNRSGFRRGDWLKRFPPTR
jgi:hypothetical protein